MTCGSMGGGATEALGGVTAVEGGAAALLVALALALGVVADPANPCTARTITSGGRCVSWQAGTTPAIAEVNTMRGTNRGVLMRRRVSHADRFAQRTRSRKKVADAKHGPPAPPPTGARKLRAAQVPLHRLHRLLEAIARDAGAERRGDAG